MFDYLVGPELNLAGTGGSSGGGDGGIRLPLDIISTIISMVTTTNIPSPIRAIGTKLTMERVLLDRLPLRLIANKPKLSNPPLPDRPASIQVGRDNLSTRGPAVERRAGPDGRTAQAWHRVMREAAGGRVRRRIEPGVEAERGVRTVGNRGGWGARGHECAGRILVGLFLNPPPSLFPSPSRRRIYAASRWHTTRWEERARADFRRERGRGRGWMHVCLMD